LNIEFTNEQFRELLLNVEVGIQIREYVYEQRNDERWESMRELEEYFLKHAHKFGCDDMVEEIDGETVLNDENTEELIDDVIEEYGSREFWEDLITQLGQRDFARSLTEEQIQAMQDNPEKLHKQGEKFFRKYEEEFEKHGVERLEII
jgi:hypothetical protein